MREYAKLPLAEDKEEESRTRGGLCLFKSPSLAEGILCHLNNALSVTDFHQCEFPPKCFCAEFQLVQRRRAAKKYSPPSILRGRRRRVEIPGEILIKLLR